MDQEQIDAGIEAANAQLKATGDNAGYAAAKMHWEIKQAELDASAVKVEAEAGPSISEAAMEVINENQLPLDLFEDYSVVSVSVARRIAEQYSAPEEQTEAEAPAEADSYMLERDEEEILGELPDDIELDDEDDEEIEDTAAF